MKEALKEAAAYAWAVAKVVAAMMAWWWLVGKALGWVGLLGD